MSKILDQLIEEGEQIKFRNNCYSRHQSVFSKASPELLAWIVCVEDFIVENYGKDSASFKLYTKFNSNKLNGYYEDDFLQEISVLKGALQACKKISPKTNNLITGSDLLLSALFDKFHLVARQLRHRHDNRFTLDINDEYDVQDLLHSLLRLYYEDIRNEEWTPSYGGKSSRMDFLLKKEQIVIEVKKTRNGLGNKELGEQLILDKAHYSVHQDCKKLICFVYDPDGRITNPIGIQNDLNSNNDALKVEVIIKP